MKFVTEPTCDDRALGVGQTFVEQTHNFPLFLLHTCTATFSKVSQKFFTTHRHPRRHEPRISDRRQAVHCICTCSAAISPSCIDETVKVDLHARACARSRPEDPRPTSADAFEKSPQAISGIFAYSLFAYCRPGQRAPERPQISSKFRPFAPPPQLLIKLSRKSGQPQQSTGTGWGRKTLEILVTLEKRRCEVGWAQRRNSGVLLA